MKKIMEKRLKHFFFETRLGKWLYGSMAILNSIEGIIHLIVATVGTAGVFKVFGLAVFAKLLFMDGIEEGVTVWALMSPNIENFVFGLFSLAVGFALGMTHHHHHH